MTRAMTTRSLLVLSLFAVPFCYAQSLRLTKEVAPTEARIELSLDAKKPNYTGTATFSLKVEKPVTSFRMHQEELTVSVKKFSKDGRPVPLSLAKGTGNDFVLSGKQPLEPGNYELVLIFSGKVSPKNDHGVFAEKEGSIPLLYTQFEPISARAAFPCFDQPDFKHPWTFAITAPSTQQVFFNTPETETKKTGSVTVHHFEKTAPLPSYLLAFSAGEFDIVDLGKGGRNQVPLRVIVPKGLKDKTHWIAQEMKRTIEAVENYFDLPYPYSKLDALVIPHLVSFGAMEHPGLVTFAARASIEVEANETLEFKQGVTETMAHEFAHQWFGDWVTLEYWDDIWLNEAFAEWLGRKVTDTLHPEWRYGKENVYGVGNAMRSDRIKSARKIRQPIANEGDIETAFDGITYQKGAAVISTVERWMGEKNFQAKVKGYLSAHANGNATSDQFFDAFGTFEKVLVRDVFAGLTDSTGIPLVRAERQCDKDKKTVRFALSRYDLTPPGLSAANASWKLPLCYRFANGKEGCTMSTEVLSLPAELPCDAPVQFNRGGVGYYLIDHPATALDTVLTAAQTTEERIALARELSYSLDNGRLSYKDVLPRAEKWMQLDDWAWRESILKLALPVARWRLPAELQPVYGSFVSKVLGPTAKQVGWAVQKGEAPEITAIRPNLNSAMVIEAEAPEFRQQATAFASQFFEGKSLPFEVIEQAVPLSVTAQPEQFFEKTKTRWMTEKDSSTRDVLRYSLQNTTAPKLAAQATALALDSKLDARETFGMWSGAPQTLAARFDFAEKNVDAMMKRLPGSSGSRIIWMLGNGCTPQEAERLEGFFRPKLGKLVGGERYLNQAKERIQNCYELNGRIIPQLSAFLKPAAKQELR